MARSSTSRSVAIRSRGPRGGQCRGRHARTSTMPNFRLGRSGIFDTMPKCSRTSPNGARRGPLRTNPHNGCSGSGGLTGEPARDATVPCTVKRYRESLAATLGMRRSKIEVQVPQAAARRSSRPKSSNLTPPGTISSNFSRSRRVSSRLTVSIVRPRWSAMS